MFTIIVVYHLFPTSNHNSYYSLKSTLELFIICFLHQTTTPKTSRGSLPKLFIICFLHQTTTKVIFVKIKDSCLSSVSYIKPQLTAINTRSFVVVYHLFPTSNHNGRYRPWQQLQVVYHLFPTSNHNRCLQLPHLHQLFIICFLHQTTT